MKPFRVLPLLEKDRVNGDPANMIIECGVPSAANVFGVGLPPLTVTAALGAELLMAMVMLWVTVFTVKVLLPELEAASVTKTSWALPVAQFVAQVGTVKVAPVKAPEEFVLVVPPIAIVDPANFSTIAELAANPEPDSVTVEPILPLVGFKEIEGVTANCEAAEFELASVTTTFFAPAV
jgi:hypothetical protein